MINFTKMHGIGNDFVILDGISEQLPPGNLAGLSQRMCDRHRGVGADGLILVERSNRAPWRMRMLNPDGSESEMCGNGLRCFAQYILDRGYETAPEFNVETGAGVLAASTVNGLIKVNMGRYVLPPKDTTLPVLPHGLYGFPVSMGNPHLVIFVPDVAAVPLESWGPELEHHSAFPERTNVHFVQVIDRGSVRQRTWERGAGITLACGTGACSVAVTGFVTGKTESKVKVHLPGGDLVIEVQEDEFVMMSGPASTVFGGVWPD